MKGKPVRTGARHKLEFRPCSNPPDEQVGHGEDQERTD